MPDVTVELILIEQVLENELAQGCSQKSVALTYAFAIRQWSPTDERWGRINRAIAERWPKGVDRVKRLAWRIVEHGPEVARGEG